MGIRRIAVFFPLAALSCAQPQSGAPAAMAVSAPAPPAAATTPVPPPTRPRLAVEADPASPEPKAHRCRAPGTYYDSARGEEFTMRVSNEGGWCRRNAVLLYEGLAAQAAPYTGMDVIDGPAHGTVQIHSLNSETVYYYRPEPGYVGSDRFVLQTQPTYGRIVVNVRVTAWHSRPGTSPGAAASPGVTSPAQPRPSTL